MHIQIQYTDQDQLLLIAQEIQLALKKNLVFFCICSLCSNMPTDLMLSISLSQQHLPHHSITWSWPLPQAPHQPMPPTLTDTVSSQVHLTFSSQAPSANLKKTTIKYLLWLVWSYTQQMPKIIMLLLHASPRRLRIDLFHLLLDFH